MEVRLTTVKGTRNLPIWWCIYECKAAMLGSHDFLSFTFSLLWFLTETLKFPLIQIHKYNTLTWYQSLESDSRTDRKSGLSSSELRAHIFNGENYDFWMIRMTTIFKSQDHWKMVQEGYEIPESDDELEDDEELSVIWKIYWEIMRWEMLKLWEQYKGQFQMPFPPDYHMGRRPKLHERSCKENTEVTRR